MVKPPIRKLIFYGLLCSAVFIFGYLSYALAVWHRDAEVNSRILAEVQSTVQSTEPVTSNVSDIGGSEREPFLTVDFESLLKRNEDVIGWLRIASIGIDMPIVQATDNSFYLDHDLDKQKNGLGWVFASASSNMQHFGTNTVFYGHNLSNKKMFGSLKELLAFSFAEPDADIIQFTTPTQEMIFRIRSIYVTDVSDMLYNGTGSQLAWRTSFVDHLQSKNQVKALDADQVTPLDQFLTLSTCYGLAGTSKRLAVHAQLVAIKDTSTAAL